MKVKKEGEVFYATSGDVKVPIYEQSVGKSVKNAAQLNETALRSVIKDHKIDVPEAIDPKKLTAIVAGLIQIAWHRQFNKADEALLAKLIDQHNARIAGYVKEPVAKTKKESKPRASHLYNLSKESIAKEKELKLSKQQQLVFDAIKALKSSTAAQITEAVVKSGQLVTRQEPARVVAFYLTTWKGEGIVEVAAA